MTGSPQRSDRTVRAGGATDDQDGYGWFEGVFVATLLTILGVILFLRTGWVVGIAGPGCAIAMGVIVHTDVESDLAVTAEVRGELVRILREAVTNAARHERPQATGAPA